MQHRRHVPLGRRRVHLAAQSPSRRKHAFLGAGRGLKDIYGTDHVDGRQGGRFRWLLSTCLAAAVGALAILVVIASSTDTQEMQGGLLSLKRMREARSGAQRPNGPQQVEGMRWAVPKTDKLMVASGPSASKYIILDAVRQRRGNRDYILNKPYARVAARLAPLRKEEASKVPPLNPYKLYANASPTESGIKSGEATHDANVKVVEQLGGLFPNEDGQEFSSSEAAELVAKFITPEKALPFDQAERVAAGELLADRSQRAAADITLVNTTVLQKTTTDSDDLLEEEGREVRIVRVQQRGETIARILSRMGAEPWQAKAMADASRSILPDQQLQPGMEVHVILLPSVVRANRMSPSRITVYGETREHRVTVMRTAAGEFAASATPVDRRIANAETADDEAMTTSSLYAAMHLTAERQGVDRETILQILRIHAYETDFRQRVRPGDGFEFFFDIKDEEKGADGSLGELLATSITAGGETRKFYRFRAPDGGTDYYDENGDTSRKFLMRRPVRSDDSRITSGFGVRRHPILQTPRMHTGVDWACAPGTPIMAAGHGVIEEADRKGEYGNYIRIRHANGYKTAYGHMQKFAPGMAPGTKVRQGQIIGYVGSTGLSSGPHVHYEVLVNNTFVDPTTLQVPRERQLSGLLLAEFQRERQRIDDLMRRNPVSTRVANAIGG